MQSIIEEQSKDYVEEVKQNLREGVSALFRNKIPLRAGVIGLGKKGWLWDVDDPLRPKPYTHVGAYLDSPDVELVAVCDTDGEVITRFKSMYPDIPAYQMAENMLYESKCDIVSIVTPTETHREMACLTARYDPVKVVFVEKPLAHNLMSASSLIRCCEDTFRVQVAVNHQRRCDPPWELAHKYSQQIAPIYKMVGYNSGDPFHAGIHMLDLFRWFGATLSEMENISPPRAYQPPDVTTTLEQVAPWHYIDLRKEKRGAYDPYLVFELDVFGEKGRVQVLHNGTILKVFERKKSPLYDGFQELFEVTIAMQYDTPTPMACAVKDIVAHIREGTPLFCTGHDGFRALEMYEKHLKPKYPPTEVNTK